MSKSSELTQAPATFRAVAFNADGQTCSRYPRAGVGFALLSPEMAQGTGDEVTRIARGIAACQAVSLCMRAISTGRFSGCAPQDSM